MSPLLYVLGTDVFTKMMITAESNCLVIKGLGPDNANKNVLCLQYVDDTLVFCAYKKEHIIA